MEGLQLVESWERLGTILVPFMVRCGAAAPCGAAIGLERALKAKPAGFRINILICLACGPALHHSIAIARRRRKRVAL